jgi:hypothetical protein
MLVLDVKIMLLLKHGIITNFIERIGVAVHSSNLDRVTGYYGYPQSLLANAVLLPLPFQFINNPTV